MSLKESVTPQMDVLHATPSSVRCIETESEPLSATANNRTLDPRKSENAEPDSLSIIEAEVRKGRRAPTPEEVHLAQERVNLTSDLETRCASERGTS